MNKSMVTSYHTSLNIKKFSPKLTEEITCYSNDKSLMLEDSIMTYFE